MLDHLKTNNRNWAKRMVSADAGFFRRLERQQAPEYLWIGCADSRVPANDIVGLDPGELFVHRNVANLAPPQDANYLSVLQFAVDVLKVKHIMVVGHYGCGGVSAAIDGKRRGLVDHWLHPIREIYQQNRGTLDAIADLGARLRRLCELNVMRQVSQCRLRRLRAGRLGARPDAVRPRLGLFLGRRSDQRPRCDGRGTAIGLAKYSPNLWLSDPAEFYQKSVIYGNDEPCSGSMAASPISTTSGSSRLPRRSAFLRASRRSA